MLTRHWNPWADFEQLHREMDELFHSVGASPATRELTSGEGRQTPTGSLATRSPLGVARKGWDIEMPKVEVQETKKTVEVSVELPGVSEEDIELNLSPKGNVLHLKGERREESTEKDEEKGWYRSERHYGVIQRAVPLPAVVSMDGAKAKLKKGVLQVKLSKQKDAPEAKRIPVQAD